MSSVVARIAPFVELIQPSGRTSVLLLCDHAGREMPPELNQLGLSPVMLERHIAYDIGAADVTRALARRLNITALLDHCSRLVIDPNRRPFTPTSIPPISDGCVVPGNQQLSLGDVRQRVRDYFLPYHRAIARRVAAIRAQSRIPVLISIHSFTPTLHGEDRPWQIGVLWRDDRRISAPVLERLRLMETLIVGDNQPYSGIDEFGFTVEFHAQRTRLPHVMFELRQNEIDTAEKAEHWATLIADLLAPVLARADLHHLWNGPRPTRAPWRSPTGLMRLR